MYFFKNRRASSYLCSIMSNLQIQNYNFILLNNYMFCNNFFFKQLVLYYNNFFVSLYFANNLFILLYSFILNKFVFNFFNYIKVMFVYFFNNFINFYKHYKFITFVGLGFKKRLNKAKNDLYLFFGHRHWIVFDVPTNFSVYFIKRKSLIMYSNNKHKLNSFMSIFKDFKRESMFKIKGLFDIRSRKRWLFMRRAKIRGLRVKLSKKQKLL